MTTTVDEAEPVGKDVFSREDQVLREARKALEQEPACGRDGPWASLVDEYEKLYRQSLRMVSMGDRMQRTLNELNLKLAESEERYRGIFEHVVEGIFRSGPEGGLVEANPALASMFGFASPAEFLGSVGAIGDLFADRSEKSRYLGQLRQQGEVRGFQAEMRRPDGGRLWAQISASLLGQDGGGPVVGVLADVTERRLMMEEMCRLARTDSLTGLWNRGYFMELARRELARARRDAKPLSLLMIDADHFKAVNDSHGHDAGDEALKTLAAVLREGLREVDLLARFGGEEFVALLPEAPSCAACSVAQRIAAGIRAAVVRCGEACLTLTVSIGVTTLAGEATSLDGLLKFADIALYAAKKKGRDRVEVYQGPECG